MNTSIQKRMASRILGIGVSRIRVSADKEVGEALTREDVRQLIEKGLIVAIPPKGNSGGRRHHLLKQKGKRRRNKHGSRKGTQGARTPSKRKWMTQVRAQRSYLSSVRPRLDPDDYNATYRRIKGGMFRSRAHVRFYLTERELLKGAGKHPKKQAGQKAGAKD